MQQKGGRRFSEKEDSSDIPDPPVFNHSNRSSDTSMDLDTSPYPHDMDTTTRNIEYLKISGEIADDADDFADDAKINANSAKILESTIGSLVPPTDDSSDRTSTYSINNFVSDGQLSESETSGLNDSFHSCDSNIVESSSEVELKITGASPPKESNDVLAPQEIPRTTSFFNRMVDKQGNLRNLSPDEDSKKLQRRAR